VAAVIERGGRRGGARLWIATLGAPVCWALRLMIAYPLVEHACRSGSTAALNAVSALATAGAVASGLLALAIAREPGEDRVAARRRFMGRGGVALAVLFLLALLAEWSSVWQGDPCAGWGARAAPPSREGPAVLTPSHMSLDETRATSPQETGRVPAPTAALVVVHSAEGEQHKGRRHALGEDDASLGRDEESTVVVASDQASRRHARIFVSGGAHVLVDLDSTNGTFLNSKLVKEQTLRHGDVIRIGSTVLKYVVER
jgi:hypothetical protein